VHGPARRQASPARARPGPRVSGPRSWQAGPKNEGPACQTMPEFEKNFQKLIKFFEGNRRVTDTHRDGKFLKILIDFH